MKDEYDISKKLDINQTLAEKVHHMLTEQLIDALATGNTVTLTCKKTETKEGISLSFTLSGTAKDLCLEIFEHRIEAE